MAAQNKPGKSFRWLASILWLNVVFWLATLLVTAAFMIVGTPYVCLFLLITRSRRRTKRVIRRSISYYGASVIRCCWPVVRVRYVDHAPDDKPPFVFISNHRSTADPFIMACLPFECIQMQKSWTSRIPVLGFVAGIAGYLRVLEMPHDTVMELGLKLLADGVSIIAFPEGTRVQSQQLGSFHGSAFRLAQQAGVKIVPLAISGSDNIHRRGAMLLHPGQIVLSKLPSLTQQQYEDISAFKLKTMVREKLRQHLETQPV
jgi:1-acyl-sn-glycerol-3-phosphate acyltransferase